MSKLVLKRKDRYDAEELAEEQVVAGFEFNTSALSLDAEVHLYIGMCNLMLTQIKDEGLLQILKRIREYFSKYLNYPRLDSVEDYRKQCELFKTPVAEDIDNIRIYLGENPDNIPNTGVILIVEYDEEEMDAILSGEMQKTPIQFEPKEILRAIMDVVQTFPSVNISVTVSSLEKELGLVSGFATRVGLIEELTLGFRHLLSTFIYFCNCTSVHKGTLQEYDEVELNSRLDSIYAVCTNIPKVENLWVY